MTEEITKPKDTFDIEVNGGPQEVFMSYGLLSELTRLVDDPDRIGNVFFDTSYRDVMIELLLMPRDEKGRPTEKEWNLSELEFDDEAAMELVAWGADHLMYFFTRNLQRLSQVGEKYKKPLASLLSSTNGTEDSASETASAGDSESPQAD